MRPAGEVRQALLQACQALVTPERAPTLREIAARAQVGLQAAEATITNMRRAGVLRVVRQRRVDYRNRPVAEYVPAGWMPAQDCPLQGLARVLTHWMR
ncbi:hypothetical protein [Paracidovorax cattleyae]|uniref:hypothetical protein n=1 Tax=Paracidovorax cattleyae TaxID=80868 RepID=UPI0018AFB772|nr:hypothetical protein [Paracidovorax cattleyae]MBF9263920.1 hypothetical protein [Paracidovorax cattleyae]